MVHVAVGQLTASVLDPAANARRGADAIGRAAAAGAKIVILPELAGSGYLTDRARLETVAERTDRPGPVLSTWQAAAREHGIAVVAGFAEAGADGALHNSAAVWDETGRFAGVYRKLHLFDAEHDAFDRGDRGLPIFEVAGIRLGVLICYDLRFPEAMRILALRGADLIAIPAAWVQLFDPGAAREGVPGQIDAALVQANLNQVFVAVADRVGEDERVPFLGCSVVASPFGKPLLGPLGPDEEAVETVALERSALELARERSARVRPREDRRPDVYGELLGYQDGSPAASADATEVLAGIERKRGYVLDMHRTLAAADPTFLAAYETLLDAAYLRERTLDRRVKELVYVAVLTALGSSRSHIAAHLRAALAAGATADELLEVLEQILPPCGLPRFMEGLEAWRDVCA